MQKETTAPALAGVNIQTQRSDNVARGKKTNALLCLMLTLALLFSPFAAATGEEQKAEEPKAKAVNEGTQQGEAPEGKGVSAPAGAEEPGKAAEAKPERKRKQRTDYDEDKVIGEVKKGEDGSVSQTIEQKGVKVEFTVTPLMQKVLMEGELAELKFKVTDSTTGESVPALRPLAWLDARQPNVKTPMFGAITCDDKIRTYLKGVLSYRPLVDFNSYYILTLNNDSTISVIDPYISLAGITQLYAMVYMKASGEDWSFGDTNKFLFVTMPKADAVAVISTESFKIEKGIAVGRNPMRIALQPDRKYLVVGIEPPQDKEGGVTVIDTTKQEAVAVIPTGNGRHEIAFSDDSLFAFVTNSKDSTLTVIDMQTLKKVKDIPLKGRPASVAYSGLSKAAYVALEDEGSLVVVDGKAHAETARIMLKPGLRVVRFAPGDKWAFVANAVDNVVNIIDVATNTVTHTQPVGKQPDQIVFSSAFAYIYTSQDDKTTLIDHLSLGKKEELIIHNIPLWQKPPGTSRYRSVADAIVISPYEGHAIIANPADEKVYYYMEGMNAAMGTFRSYGGHLPKAAKVVDRSLRPVEAGVYSSSVRLPVSGEYDAAFLLDMPKVVHCFNFSALVNPVFEKGKAHLLEVISTEREAAAGEDFTLNFRFIQNWDKQPITEQADVTIMSIHSSGMPTANHAAKYNGDGSYSAVMRFTMPGYYSIVIKSSKLKLGVDKTEPVIVKVSPAAKKEKAGTQ